MAHFYYREGYPNRWCAEGYTPSDHIRDLGGDPHGLMQTADGVAEALVARLGGTLGGIRPIDSGPELARPALADAPSAASYTVDRQLEHASSCSHDTPHLRLNPEADDDMGGSAMRLQVTGVLAMASCLSGAAPDETTIDETTIDETLTDTTHASAPSFVGNDLALTIRGASPDCLAQWNVTHVASSLSCPNCDFSLSWQFEVTYHWSSASTVSGCEPPDAFVLYVYDDKDRISADLEMSSNWWAWTPDGFDGKAMTGTGSGGLAIGHRSGDEATWNELYPGTWHPESGDFLATGEYYTASQASGNVVWTD